MTSVLVKRLSIGVVLIAIQLAWLGACAARARTSAENRTASVSGELKERLSRPEKRGASFCRREGLCGQAVLARFYRKRAFRPAWMGPEGRFAQARDLVDAIQKAPLEGLTADAYHLTLIETLLQQIEAARHARNPVDPKLQADLDLLLTDAFLVYGSHLLSGRVNPETIYARWAVTSREADLAAILDAALEEKGGVKAALAGLLPQYPAYARLGQALADYRALAEQGGWPSVPEGPALHKGDRGPRIAVLRARLVASGDLDTNADGDPEVFDDLLERGVRRFQGRYGLTVDGVVGPATLSALNVPVADRIRQIEINMERWRWLPDDLGKRYILVNTAAFFLKVVDGERTVLAMKVIAGRKARRTPVFSGLMTYLVLNPYWHIPHKLAARDILPKIKKDPGYLERQGIHVFASWEESAPEIPPEEIDWSRVTERNFSFKLRQDPGPMNALGRVKFMFPNKFAVYLHDTPARTLFERSRRDFSSGCIRVERPIDLAAYVLRGDPKWTRDKIVSAIETRRNRIVWLPEPIPVHVLYWTAWVDRKGTLCFRSDVYGRDGPLDAALRERPLRYQ